MKKKFSFSKLHAKIKSENLQNSSKSTLQRKKYSNIDLGQYIFYFQFLSPLSKFPQKLGDKKIIAKKLKNKHVRFNLLVEFVNFSRFRGSREILDI